MSLYQEIILDHYKNPKNFGTVSDSSHAARSKNPLCGDDISMTLRVEGERVMEVCFSGTGCAISVAAASMLTEFVKGKPVHDVRALTPQTLLDMLHVELTPIRMKCALLPLEVLKKALAS